MTERYSHLIIIAIRTFTRASVKDELAYYRLYKAGLNSYGSFPCNIKNIYKIILFFFF